MKKVSKEQVSRYRQEISRQIENLKSLCMKAGYGDLLFRGTPVEFYKKCGKKNCHCAQGGEHRHGPYSGIQLSISGKQRHISLRQSEGHYLEMVRHYQYQQENRRKIAEAVQVLLETVDGMLEARTIWEKRR